VENKTDTMQNVMN